MGLEREGVKGEEFTLEADWVLAYNQDCLTCPFLPVHLATQRGLQRSWQTQSRTHNMAKATKATKLCIELECKAYHQGHAVMLGAMHCVGTFTNEHLPVQFRPELRPGCCDGLGSMTTLLPAGL